MLAQRASLLLLIINLSASSASEQPSSSKIDAPGHLVNNATLSPAIRSEREQLGVYASPEVVSEQLMVEPEALLRSKNGELDKSAELKDYDQLEGGQPSRRVGSSDSNEPLDLDNQGILLSDEFFFYESPIGTESMSESSTTSSLESLSSSLSQKSDGKPDIRPPGEASPDSKGVPAIGTSPLVLDSNRPQDNSVEKDVDRLKLESKDNSLDRHENDTTKIAPNWLVERLLPGDKQPVKSVNDGKSNFCIGTVEHEQFAHWKCVGSHLVSVPPALKPKPTSLRLLNTAIETLTRHSLENYESLRDFSIENAQKLRVIEAGTFSRLSKLRVVYIFMAPKLQSFDLVVSGLHPDLTLIRIQQTSLGSWPNMSQFRQDRILTSVDLVNNKIANFGPDPINIRTELLNMEFNLIDSIGEQTFNGSEIGVLSLSGNRLLTYIHPNAFANLRNLIKLDLSHTSVSSLPSVGLQQLRSLIIRDNYALKKIPSIYVFPVLEEAHLTYAYHCCSFRYPQTHDPTAYEDHMKLQEEINRMCADKSTQGEKNPNKMPQPGRANSAVTASPTSAGEQAKDGSGETSLSPPNLPWWSTTTTTTENSEFEGFFGPENKLQPEGVADKTTTLGSVPAETGQPVGEQTVTIKSFALPTATINISDANASGGSTGQPIDKPGQLVEPKKKWHDIECGELVLKHDLYQNITCTPEPDPFNPCEDIMGYTILRIAVWFVVGASVCGNLSVIVVLVSVFRRLSVPKFLQLNLAIGDLAMGLYLGMLAAADLSTVGSYFNYAIDWQHGYGCKIAGAASLFASQLSIFTLCVITFERYYTITYSIDLNMRLQLGWAARIMFVGWLYAFLSAMLPIFADINSYTKTSICVPMRTTYLVDKLFIIFLLVIDSSAFIIIFISYLRMFLLVLRQKTEATAKERTVAKRMALLVFTDFACWAPIIFFGATAFLGRPLISVTNSKILIVFFYPLNSMANPFLYVISTRAYRRDLDYLTQRWQVWRKNLFRPNNDSYYSNNAYERAIQYNNLQTGNLNAHLGAVAAVTGVANHLHHNHLVLDDYNINCDRLLPRVTTSPNLLLPYPRALEEGCIFAGSGAASGGLAKIQQKLKLHDHHHHHQRVVCSKAHKSQYVIRHQIITSAAGGSHLNRDHARQSRQQQRFLASSKHTPAKEVYKSQTTLGQLTKVAVIDDGTIKHKESSPNKDESSISKRVNISQDNCTDSSNFRSDGDHPSELKQQANRRGKKVRERCGRKTTDKSKLGSSAASGNPQSGSSSTSRKKRPHKGAKCCDIDCSVASCCSPCSRCCNNSNTTTSGCCQKSSSLQNNPPQASNNHPDTCKANYSYPLSPIYIQEPTLSSSGNELRSSNMSQNSIDILGNISYNEPTSSISGSLSNQRCNKEETIRVSRHENHKREELKCIGNVDGQNLQTLEVKSSLESSSVLATSCCKCKKQVNGRRAKRPVEKKVTCKLCASQNIHLEVDTFKGDSELSHGASNETSADFSDIQNSKCDCLVKRRHHRHHHQHHHRNHHHRYHHHRNHHNQNDHHGDHSRRRQRLENPMIQDVSQQTDGCVTGEIPLNKSDCKPIGLQLDEISNYKDENHFESNSIDSTPVVPVEETGESSRPKEPESILKTANKKDNLHEMDSNSSSYGILNGNGLMKTTSILRFSGNQREKKKRVSIISNHHSR